MLLCRPFGLDVAPDAVVVANAKVDLPSIRAVKSLIAELPFCSSGSNHSPWQIKTFFSPKTLGHLIAIRDCLLDAAGNGNGGRRKAANFLLGTLLGILHGHSKVSLSLPCSHSFAMAPNYVRKYARKAGLRRPARDVKACLEVRVAQLLEDRLPACRGSARIQSAEEADKLRNFRNGGFADLIVTSPPYLNVQIYAKDSWLRFWLLNQDYRQLKAGFIETGSPELYLQKMKPCLTTMLKVLRPLHYAVIVAGDAPYTRRGKRRYFGTATKLGELASQMVQDNYTFRIVETIRDSIPSCSRYYSAVHKDGKKNNRDNGRKGVKLERILILRKVRYRQRRSS